MTTVAQVWVPVSTDVLSCSLDHCLGLSIFRGSLGLYLNYPLQYTEPCLNRPRPSLQTVLEAAGFCWGRQNTLLPGSALINWDYLLGSDIKSQSMEGANCLKHPPKYFHTPCHTGTICLMACFAFISLWNCALFYQDDIGFRNLTKSWQC